MKQQLDMTDEEFSEEIEWNGGCVKKRQVEDETKNLDLAETVFLLWK